MKDQFSPEAVAARLEIRARIDGYCRGVDRRDKELIKRSFHDDAIDDHGPFRGNAHEFADWIVERLKPLPIYGQHHVTNCLIELDGDRAAVESYYLAYHPRLDESTGRHVLLQNGGRYLDRFERRGGEWKIAERRVTVDWSRAELPGEPWAGQSQFQAIGPIGNDPSDGLFSSDLHSSGNN